MLISFDARLYGTKHRGIGRYIACLLEEVKKIDLTNQYILFSQNAGALAKFKNWQIVNSPYGAYSFAEQINFPWLLKKFKFDLMHFPHWNVPIIYSGPYLVTIHDLILHHFPNERATTLPIWLYKLKVKIYYQVISRVIKQANKIIAVSQSTAEEIINYYPGAKNKLQVILEAPTIDGRNYQKQTLPKLIPQEYLLNVGAAYPHKNLELLISVFAKLIKTNPQLKLVLVGRQDFFYKRLEQQAIRQKLNKNIIFWGEAQESDLASLYQHGLAYIAPSLAEGFNLGAVEALSFNLPVVASDIAVHREILKNTALYFESLSIDDLEAKLKLIIEKTDYQRNWRSTVESAIAGYRWQKTAHETIACYQSML